MTRKEVVEQALNHKEGRMPVDFGGSPTTVIHCPLGGKIRDYYGLEQRPVKVIEPYQMPGEIEDDHLNDWIHQHTAWKTFKHSCGAVEKFMPLFIESGFDALKEFNQDK